MNESLQDLIASPGLKYFLFGLIPLMLVGAFLLSRPSQIITIAKNTFVESVRQPIYFVIIMLCAIFQIFSTWSAAYSMGYTETSEVSGDNKVLLDIGLATIFVCGMLLAAFVATAVISREIERKTVLTVVSKPISRTAVVLGKYLGVAGAITIAVITMVTFLLMGIRHGVMSTASDEPDMPVILFSFLAIGLSIGIGAWCNFFYGWAFTQTSTMLMCPLMLIAYVLVLLINKHWEMQAIGTDFMPQISLACLALLLAQLVMTAIATAASSRLGQVMTIVICSGVFVFGLLSNHIVGRNAFHNVAVGRIKQVSYPSEDMKPLSEIGDTAVLELEYEPTSSLKQGSPFYFGPNPNGFPLSNYSYAAPEADYTKPDTYTNYQFEPALVISDIAGRRVTVKHVGRDAVLTRFSPQEGDFVFVRPTRINVGWWGVWGMIPNVQSFWLVDAISQNQPVPASHIGLIGIYAVAQIGVFLSLAVMLFQTREVG